MQSNTDFSQVINAGYNFKGDTLLLGTAMYNNVVIPESPIKVPLKMMNRHGLIAGATGTGKTKTLQVMAESLCQLGVPVLMMDIKGDLSGIAMPGVENDKIKERYSSMHLSWQPHGNPVTFLTLSQEKGIRLRATVSDFGSIFLSKILDLNDNQQGVLALIFKYCNDHQIPLIDLKDLVTMLQFAMDQGKDEVSKDYGNVSSASAGTILRKIVELQNQGADLFFGEPAFQTNDLLNVNLDGNGCINIFRVTDIQDKPKLFSTFMLHLLNQLYKTLPEVGDLDKPKLAFFIDEAHLIFDEASKPLLDLLESTIKLIRSKGVGVYFCTQTPTDIPANILGQLGLKIQHSLRAFTANDRKAIKQTAENYPETTFYKTEDLLTQMGTGVALISVLDEKGLPTPLAETMMISPSSRMDILTDTELTNLIAQSPLVAKYNTEANSRSATEIIQEKLQQQTAQASDTGKSNTNRNSNAKTDPSVFSEIVNSSAGKQVQRSLIRMFFQFLTKLLTGKSR